MAGCLWNTPVDNQEDKMRGQRQYPWNALLFLHGISMLCTQALQLVVQHVCSPQAAIAKCKHLVLPAYSSCYIQAGMFKSVYSIRYVLPVYLSRYMTS